MSTIQTITLLVASLLFASCFGGYDPQNPVSISVEADSALNTYDGVGHRMDLYIFKLNETHAFDSAAISDLLKENQGVPGGQGLNRQSIEPGQVSELRLGAMIYEMYTHIGVVGAYREPQGQTRMTAEIPGDGELRLVLGPNGIIRFKDAD